MSEAYLRAAVNARKLSQKRRNLPERTMSNKFALSEVRITPARKHLLSQPESSISCSASPFRMWRDVARPTGVAYLPAYKAAPAPWPYKTCGEQPTFRERRQRRSQNIGRKRGEPPALFADNDVSHVTAALHVRLCPAGPFPASPRVKETGRTAAAAPASAAGSAAGRTPPAAAIASHNRHAAGCRWVLRAR